MPSDRVPAGAVQESEAEKGSHRLLVSGANGFVGQILAGLARSHPEAGRIRLIPLSDADGRAVDIRDGDKVADFVREAAPTAVIHLAAVALPRQAAAQPDEAWAVNVMGTFNLANAVLRHAPSARFILAGSSEAYGESLARANGAPLGEDAALDPLTPYGATKAAADIMIGQMARQGLAAVRFRPFNHTGPGQAPAYVIPSFARQIVRIERGWQEPVMRVGNLAVQRDFLDARDVASAYLSAALGGPLGVYNLASGKPVAIEAMLEMMLARSSANITVETDPALLRKGEVETICGDATRVKNEHGWQPAFSLEETLGDVIEDWRNLADTAPDSVKS